MARDPDAPIRVALLLPLSGRHRKIGQVLFDAAQMALFDVGDPRLTLVPFDTGGTPEGAEAASLAAIADGAELILGPLFSQEVRAAAPPAREKGINIVAFSTDTAVAGDGVYLMGLTVPQQIDRAIGHARRQGLSTFAILAPDGRYGQAVLDALEKALATHGGELANVTLYPAGTGPNSEAMHQAVRRAARYDERNQALKEEIARLKALDDESVQATLEKLERADTFGDLDYQALVLPEGGGRLRAIAPLLPFYDIDTRNIRLIGTGLWDDPGLGREPSLVGGWFAAPPPANARRFRERFAELYGQQPPRLASIAYDATALAGVLAQGDGGPDFTRTALENGDGFVGYDGIFRLLPNGIAERGLAVLEVRPDDLVVVSPAPERFDATIY